MNISDQEAGFQQRCEEMRERTKKFEEGLRKKQLDKIKALEGKVKLLEKEIREWRKVSRSKVTPELPGDNFEHGWRLGINRVCNSIEKIINK